MRFVGRDPAKADLEQPLSLNEYQYCLNNPLRFVDPDGRLYTKAEEQASLMNKTITKYGIYTPTSKGVISDYNAGKINQLVCNQYVGLYPFQNRI